MGETAADALGFDYHLIRSDAIFNFTGLGAEPSDHVFRECRDLYINSKSKYM